MVKKDPPSKKGKMDDSAPDDEPPKDPRMNQYHSSTVDEVEGHRHQNVYLGLQIPIHRHRSRHHRHRHHHRHGNKDSAESNRPAVSGNQHHHHRHHPKNHRLNMQSIDEESTDGFYRNDIWLSF